MTRRRITGIALSAALALTAILATSAHASFHLIKVREVHEDAAGGIAGDYAMLQMYADGQNLLATHHIRFFDGAGSVLADYELPNVANGQNQRTVLVGNTGVAGADFSNAGVNIQTSGAVCWNTGGLGMGGIDCAAWGSFVQGAEPLSSPALPAGPPLLAGQSDVRTITRGCATLLDDPDDTNNSSADFFNTTPIGRNNAATPTEKPCTTETTTKKKKKCKKKRKKKRGASAAAKKKKRCGKKKKRK